MTTIEEMDEFFNFEDAAQPHPDDFSYLTDGPFDLDLAFTQPEHDEDSLACLQHFSGDNPDPLSLDLQNAMQNTPMTPSADFTAQDFTDFPRWIEGMNVPFQPCDYCKKMRIHCKVLKEGHRKGSCTSCVALARSCSLTLNPKAQFYAGDNCEGTDAACLPQTEPMVEDHEFDASEALADWNEVTNNSSHWKPISTKSPIEENERPYSHNNSATDLVALKSSNENLHADAAESGAKSGPRFSRETLRVLKSWLSAHHKHPYPTDSQKEGLQRQTGLNKIQITNWLANARRRGKARAPRSTSPSPNMDNYAIGMDIPRRGTPAMKEMNPLERWKNSPPEHEPASVTAIAKAVTSSTFSSGRESPYTSYGHTDDGSARSLCNVSSASSLGTSHGTSHSSGGSFASAFSHKSRGSFGSFGNRGRRRRRKQAPKPAKVTDFATVVPRTYQCTFCTETFKTKHDWQRHEKSLHLSLERWICSPNGPTQLYAQHNHAACVYCAVPNPPEGHAEVHNHSSCAERSLEERTFYRKDHLRQHLNLVHDAKFQAWSMDTWKVATPEIRSRCGFCGIVMDSWSIRVDHLAEHFKGGKSMADWKGDWGFEPQVLDIVENGMPPYLIHDERNTMRPFEASKETADLHRTLEDLVKLGLVDFINDHVVQGSIPTDEMLLEEGRKVVTRTETSKRAVDADISWFRDLITLSGKNPNHTNTEQLLRMESSGLPELSWAERCAIINAQAPKDGTNLDTIHCEKQRSLMGFVVSRRALGLTPTDSELRKEACKILDDLEVHSNFKCKSAVSWFKYLINHEVKWLAEFRRRAGLPRTEEMGSERVRSTDDTTIDYSIHNMGRLEEELKLYVQTQLAAGIRPTDFDLQRQARLIIYNNDDPWNQTAADVPELLLEFKLDNGLASPAVDNLPALPESVRLENDSTSASSSNGSPPALHWDLGDTSISDHPARRTPAQAYNQSPNQDQPLHTLAANQPSTNTNPVQPLRYFLNDANCYGRLVRELKRFVTSCMSPNNPNQHVPSDAEIQNQARWVIYDDDDPWNQTAADNAEWLMRFKRDAGLLSGGPGLPESQPSWRVSNGGTGFSPPYLNPKTPPAPFSDPVSVKMQQKTYQVSAQTAGQFLRSMGERWQKPAAVFCSRDLENSLSAFVRAELARGILPSDDHLRAKARDIMRMPHTPADDAELLEKFKALHGLSLSQCENHARDLSPSSIDLSPSYTMDVSEGPLPDFTLPNFTTDVEMLAGFDMELGAMDLTTDFGAGAPSDFRPDVGMGLVCEDVLTEMDGSPFGLRSMAGGGSNDDEVQDYAGRFRVHAATASPLRRRVSERAAAKVGSVRDPTGNMYAG